MPSGRYLIALFDGSEGGTHYTWDFIRIEGAVDGDAGADGSGIKLWSIAAFGVVVLMIATLLWRHRRAGDS